MASTTNRASAPNAYRCERSGVTNEELSPSYLESWRRSGGWELAEHRAVLPGKHGLECSVYQYLYYKTMHLRPKLYVTFAAEGGMVTVGEAASEARKQSEIV